MYILCFLCIYIYCVCIYLCMYIYICVFVNIYTVYIYIIHIEIHIIGYPPKPTCLQFLVIFTVLGGLLCNVGRKPSPVTRLPSERRDTNIDRSCVGDIPLDLLSDRDKKPLLESTRPVFWKQTHSLTDMNEGADHDREGCC